MTLKDFIDQHKAKIDATIRSQAPGTRIDDDERELWIMNDEHLYRLALKAGVNI